jgi:hypothetical protein
MCRSRHEEPHRLGDGVLLAAARRPESPASSPVGAHLMTRAPLGGEPTSRRGVSRLRETHGIDRRQVRADELPLAPLIVADPE